MKKTAILPGGFKPPHKGHYAIAKILSEEGEVLVRVGSGERDGITQDMSIKIWKIYGFEAEPAAKNSPIHDVFTYVEKEAEEGEIVYVGTGEKDFPRFKVLTDPSFNLSNSLILSSALPTSTVSLTSIFSKTRRLSAEAVF